MLPQTTTDRIKAEAEKKYPKFSDEVNKLAGFDLNPPVILARKSHIEAAESEASRCAEIVEALKKSLTGLRVLKSILSVAIPSGEQTAKDLISDIEQALEKYNG